MHINYLVGSYDCLPKDQHKNSKLISRTLRTSKEFHLVLVIICQYVKTSASKKENQKGDEERI